MQDTNHNHQVSSSTAPFTGGASYLQQQQQQQHQHQHQHRLRPPQLPLIVPYGHVAFRLLCHASRIGGIIGKSGSIIKQLQQETSAKIRIEDSFPNSEDHRVILIIASALVVRRFTLDSTIKRRNQEYSELNNDDDDDDERMAMAVAVDVDVQVSAAQEAVVRVFQRFVEVSAESNGVVMPPGGLVSCRLLAEASQVGSVIGKGGKVVEKIRKDTGCRIKVLTSEKLQSCSDEMVEIEGDILGVKRALVAVTSRLQDCATSFEKAKITGTRQFEANLSQTLPSGHANFTPQRISGPQALAGSSSNYAPGSRSFSVEGEKVSTMESRSTHLDVVFRILCLNDRVGGVIGKGGSIIRTLQTETGSSISVGPAIAGCDERLITITSIENLDSRQSGAQNAILRVFEKLVDGGVEKEVDVGTRAYHISLRLAVPSNQVGCLLGKGGAIVSEMRKITSTSIKIIGGDQLPICASINDEVVQITGEYENVRSALYDVTSRLRDNIRATKLPSTFISEKKPYGRVRDSSRLGVLPSMNVPQSVKQQNTLTKSMENLGLSQSSDRPPSPRQWASQGSNQRSITEGKGLASVRGGLELGRGSRSAIVKNTTVEIVVPENVIDSVYGENGCNLIRLRQISGAKVTVHESQPGTTDRIVIISGCPDETQAAQSLLQAFIVAGSS